jgi:non-ribosomal peptide synthetase component E (peptide arylation enzyme)
MNVAGLLERSAAYFPERTALVFKDRRWTYRELDRKVSALASGLKRLDLTAGERIGLQEPVREGSQERPAPRTFLICLIFLADLVCLCYKV